MRKKSEDHTMALNWSDTILGNESIEDVCKKEEGIQEKYNYLEGFFRFQKITKVVGDGSFNISFACQHCPSTTKALMGSTKAISNLCCHISSVHSRLTKEYDSLKQVQIINPSYDSLVLEEECLEKIVSV